jgi:predicted metal-dependent hydrolase
MTADELKSELESLCVEWQKVLRLQDWTVTIEINWDKAFCGSCTLTTNRKLATVTICHPDVQGDADKDYETTLVHELLHLHGSGFDELIKSDTAERTGYEQMIDLTANALVSLKRLK